MLPKFEQRLVERLLDRFYDRRLLAHVEHRTRLGHAIRGNSVTLYGLRPSFQDPAAWDRSPIAQFRFNSRSGLWSLYWRDRNRRWRLYEDVAATRNLELLVTEVDRDPTSIFWG